MRIPIQKLWNDPFTVEDDICIGDIIEEKSTGKIYNIIEVKLDRVTIQFPINNNDIFDKIPFSVHKIILLKDYDNTSREMRQRIKKWQTLHSKD